MRSKKNNHGRNHGCKGSIHRYHRLVIKEIVIVTRSFHDRIYMVSMGMNTSSRSTPTSPMHNLSFTSHVRWSCSVEIFIWWSTRRVWLMKNFEFTHIMEGIGSTHRGIMEAYTTSFNSKYHQLESRAWLAKSRNRIYQRHYVSGKELPKWLNKNPTRFWWSIKDLMWVSAHNQRKNQCKEMRL